MKRTVNAGGVSQSKLDHIRQGTTKKTDVGGVKANKKVISGKGGKFEVTEVEKKFEEAGVKRKKRNYVMYESKLGTEKEKNLQKIEEAPKPKPKPKPVPKPRVEEKIVQKKKKVEYLDNYQYKETKNIKDHNPNKVSIVTHQRLGDIIGGSFEETTYQKHTMTDTGKGPRLYSQQTTKTTTRRDAKGKPVEKKTTTTQRSNTASRTVPAKSREMRKEVRKFATNTNLKPAPKKQETKTTTKTVTKTTTTRTTTKPAEVKKVTTRTQSAPKGGRRH